MSERPDQAAPAARRLPHLDVFSGRHVAVVDDDPHVARVLERWLRHVGATTSTYALGATALAGIAASPPDLVLLDLVLPDADGLDVCRSLRAGGGQGRMPILVMTGFHEPELQVEALHAMADDYVPKPVSREVLLARAGNLLRRAAAEADNARLIKKLARYVSTAAFHQAVHVRPLELLDAAVLFSDVRNFTATSYGADLATIFEAVNAVLTQQSRIVRDHGGYVDKFSGDGMLAVFPGEQGAIAACRAGLSIARWAASVVHAFNFWSPLPIGIGVHFGPIARGDIGDDERREFTLIGNTVNLAARLCGVAGPLEVVITEQVLSRLDQGFAVVRRRELALKGVPQATSVLSIDLAEG